MQSSRTITTCALTIALAGLVGLPLFAEPAAEERAEKPQEAGRAGGAEAAAPRRRARGSESTVWWNSPGVIEQLSLTDAQRQKMDGHLETFRRAEPDESPRAEFAEALASGKWREARELLKQLEARAVESIRSRGQLKIDVLAVLNDEQRKKLVERYRRLIDQPWSQVMRPEGRGR
jgi:Spy/CpxP family protein refolding chaperone